MNDWSIILFSASMIILFILPFLIITATKDRKKARHRQKKRSS